MTLSLYSTIRAWKRENERERAQRQAAARPHGAMQQDASAFYAAIAAMGCGLGGMACADTLEAHKP
jgi:hypothetical protein